MSIPPRLPIADDQGIEIGHAARALQDAHYAEIQKAVFVAIQKAVCKSIAQIPEPGFCATVLLCQPIKVRRATPKRHRISSCCFLTCPPLAGRPSSPSPCGREEGRGLVKCHERSVYGVAQQRAMQALGGRGALAHVLGCFVGSAPSGYIAARYRSTPGRPSAPNRSDSSPA